MQNIEWRSSSRCLCTCTVGSRRCPHWMASSTSATVLAGHSDVVWACVFSHDRSHLATASSDRTARVWSLLTPPGPGTMVRGKEVACLDSHTGVVKGCGFSPDSSLLATCSWDESIHIHSCSNFLLLCKLHGHRDAVSAVKFSPNGRVLVSCSWDRNLGVWDVQTGTLLHWLQGHSSPVTSCTFLHGGSILASCSWDKSVKLWDLSSSPQREIATLSGHPSAVYDLSSAGPLESNLLASCGRDGALILWDLRSQVPWQVMQRSLLELNSVCFSPSATNFITGDSMGDLQLWDMAAVKTSSINSARPSTLRAHASSVSNVCFSVDGALFASSSSDYTCHVWNSADAFGPSVTSLADSLAGQLSLNS